MPTQAISPGPHRTSACCRPTGPESAKPATWPRLLVQFAAEPGTLLIQRARVVALCLLIWCQVIAGGRAQSNHEPRTVTSATAITNATMGGKKYKLVKAGKCSGMCDASGAVAVGTNLFAA